MRASNTWSGHWSTGTRAATYDIGGNQQSRAARQSKQQAQGAVHPTQADAPDRATHHPRDERQDYQHDEEKQRRR